MKEKEFNGVMDYLKEVQKCYEEAFNKCDEKDEVQKAYYKGRSDGMNYSIYVLSIKVDFTK